jgi:hypothetical protein
MKNILSVILYSCLIILAFLFSFIITTELVEVAELKLPDNETTIVILHDYTLTIDNPLEISSQSDEIFEIKSSTPLGKKITLKPNCDNETGICHIVATLPPGKHNFRCKRDVNFSCKISIEITSPSSTPITFSPGEYRISFAASLIVLGAIVISIIFIYTAKLLMR